jgi:hypothetical protein
MLSHHHLVAKMSLLEQWNQLNKTSKNLIYCVIAAAPAVGFALLAESIKNDFRIVAGIAAATSGIASVGFFVKSIYYCQTSPQEEQEEKRAEEQAPLFHELSP